MSSNPADSFELRRQARAEWKKLRPVVLEHRVDSVVTQLVQMVDGLDEVVEEYDYLFESQQVIDIGKMRELFLPELAKVDEAFSALLFAPGIDPELDKEHRKMCVMLAEKMRGFLGAPMQFWHREAKNA